MFGPSNEQLATFDGHELRVLVHRRREMLMSAFRVDEVREEGAVLVLAPEAISPRLAEELALYRSQHGWAFHLYSGTDQEYEQFLDRYWHDLYRRGRSWAT